MRVGSRVESSDFARRGKSMSKIEEVTTTPRKSGVVSETIIHLSSLLNNHWQPTMTFILNAEGLVELTLFRSDRLVTVKLSEKDLENLHKVLIELRFDSEPIRRYSKYPQCGQCGDHHDPAEYKD